jgi:hypothetical protein
VTLTLWRGEQLLGELRTRAPSPRPRPEARVKPPSLSAFLIPAEGAPALSGVWQLRFPFGPAVRQHPVEPDIVAERYLRPQQENSGPVALQPMSPEEEAGVPREIQLTVRDAAGTVFLPRQLHLLEVRYEPEHYETARREVPAEALVNGSVWCLFVAFASELDAPAI